MRRREFITLLGGAAVARPFAARAQQVATPVIGFLDSGSFRVSAHLLAAFRQGLSETGYSEGRNVAIEYRSAEGQYDRLPAFAADLVRHQVSVIVAGGGPSGPAAKAATSTIPIVFYTAVDPVEAGLVASLSRPGGNLTGATLLNMELGPKRLELLHELLPKATILAALVNPANANAETISRGLQTAARTLGIKLHVLHASSERDLEAVFATLVGLRAGGLVIGADSFFNSQGKLLADLSVRHAVPTVFQYREFAASGGLIGYGGSNMAAYRVVGVYTGRILKGEKPGDLPVQQSTKFELIINLRTAKTFGVTVPDQLLALADEVIE
jgi:putative ABC transport system substrate-binding protein